jgi:hypothetical protein
MLWSASVVLAKRLTRRPPASAVTGVWPADQVVQARDEQRRVLRMRFKDHELYHASLSGAIAARIGGPAAVARHHRALGGIKLYGLEDSVHPAVRLLNARAPAELRARLCLCKGRPGGCCRRHSAWICQALASPSTRSSP